MLQAISFLFAAALVLGILIFLLSVFAPAHSCHPFWRTILLLRGGIDFICYWLFNLAALSSAAYALWWCINRFLLP